MLTVARQCQGIPFRTTQPAHRKGGILHRMASTGLCERCHWSRRVPNRRGAVFRLCRRAEGDPRYDRYPRLPVLVCAGFEARGCDTMERFLVLTVIGEDKPGLVEKLAQTIAAHDGNWLESRMAHLAGKFAGVLRVSLPPTSVDPLVQALERLGADGLKIVCETGSEARDRPRAVRLELLGADHPGIVRDISTALARRRVNVEELHTGRADAPMSGDKLFQATARLHLPPELSLDDLRRELESVAQDLMVDVTLLDDVPNC